MMHKPESASVCASTTIQPSAAFIERFAITNTIAVTLATIQTRCVHYSTFQIDDASTMLLWLWPFYLCYRGNPSPPPFCSDRRVEGQDIGSLDMLYCLDRWPIGSVKPAKNTSSNFGQEWKSIPSSFVHDRKSESGPVYFRKKTKACRQLWK